MLFGQSPEVNGSTNLKLKNQHVDSTLGSSSQEFSTKNKENHKLELSNPQYIDTKNEKKIIQEPKFKKHFKN